MTNEVKLKLAIEGGQIVSTTIDGVTTRIGALDDAARTAASGSDTLKTALGGLLTVGAAMTLVKMADAATTLQTQLHLSSNSAAEASKAYGALFDIAQQGRVSFTELGTTYAAISRAGKELGVSQSRLLDVTKSISQAMTIGGGSAASMQAALMQLGQGLSSGTLRGEELNSIMEQTPRLAKAIADGLGVPIGELRKLGEAGALTSQQVISALEKSGPALAKEMESATLTVGQAFTMLGNSTVKFVGEADKASGASATLAGALKTVSESIDTVGKTINEHQTAFAAITGGLGGAAAIAGLAGVASNIGKIKVAFVALSAVMAANPITLTLMGIGAAVGGAYAMVDANSKTLESMKAELKKLESSTGVSIYGIKSSDAAMQKNQENITRLRGAIAELEAASNKYGNAEDKRLAEHTQGYKDEQKQIEKIADLLTKSSGVPDAYIKRMKEIQSIGVENLSQDQRNAALAGAHDLLKKDTAGIAAHKKELTEAAKALEFYNDLMDQASGYSKTYAEDQNKLALSFRNGGIKSYEDYAAAVQKLVGQQPGMKALADAEQKEAQAAAKRWGEGYAKQIAEEEKAYRKLADAIDSVDKSINAMLRENNAMQASNELDLSLMGQTAEARAKAIEQQQVLNKYIEEERKARETITDPAVLTSKLDLINTQKLRAVDLAAQKQSITDWNRANDRISDGLVSALTKGGHEGAQQVRDLLVKELVMEPFQIVVRALLQPVTQGLTNMALGAVGQATGMDFLSGAGSAASLYSMGSKAYGWLTGAGATESIYSLASATQTVAAASQAATTSIYSLAGSVPAATEGLTLAANGVNFVAPGTTGAAFAGNSAAAAGGTGSLAVAGYAAAFLAAVYLLDNAGSTPAKDSGGYYATFNADGSTQASNKQDPMDLRTIDPALITIPESIFGTEQAYIDTQISNLTAINDSIIKSTELQNAAREKSVNALETSYLSAAKSLGITAISGNFSARGTTGKEGENPNTLITSTFGGAAYDSGEVLNSDPAALALAASRAILSALQASSIPQYMSGVFDGLVASTATQDQITAALANGAALKTFHDNLMRLPDAFQKLAGISYSATQELIKAAGSLEKLDADLAGYYTNFYTEAEKTAQLTTNTAKAFTDLGLVMPTVDEALRANYRAEVERLGALDLSVEANAKAYAGAVALQGSVSTLATTFDAAADKMAKALASLQSEVDKYNLNAGTATDITIAQSATDRAWAKVIEKLPGVSGISQVDAAHWLATASAEMLATVAGAAMPEVTAFLAAFNSLTSATTAAAQTTIDAAQALQDSFSAAGKGIYDFVQDLIRSTATTDQLWATYKTDLVLAQAGDVKASERITTSAQAYLEKQRAGASTTAEAALATARMVSELSALPAAQSYEQEMVNQLKIIAQNTGTTALAVVTTAAGGAGESLGTSYGFGTTPTLTGSTGSTSTASSGLMALLAQQGMTIADMTQAQIDSYLNWGFFAFDMGTNYLPEDMLAQVHKGERIIPAADNALLMQRLQSPQGNNDVLVAEIIRLNATNDRLEKRLAAIEANTKAGALHGHTTARNTGAIVNDGVIVRNDKNEELIVGIQA